MLRIHVALAVFAALLGSAAAETPPVMDRATVVRVANTCTAEGAFGHKFGETWQSGATGQLGYPVFHAAPGPDWAPLSALDGSYSPRSHQLWHLKASVNFGEPSQPGSPREAMARQLFEAVDAEVRATRQYTARNVETDFGWMKAVLYTFGADRENGFSLRLVFSASFFNLQCASGNFGEIRRREILGKTP